MHYIGWMLSIAQVGLQNLILQEQFLSRNYLRSYIETAKKQFNLYNVRNILSTSIFQMDDVNASFLYLEK